MNKEFDEFENADNLNDDKKLDSYEDIKCPSCGRIGMNTIETYAVKGHPELEEKWLVCKCGNDLMEITE